MTTGGFPAWVPASVAALTIFSVGACGERKQPLPKQEAVWRCGGEYKRSYWAVVEDRKGTHERVIAAMTRFAQENVLDYEASRYPEGVPGNRHPQFLMSMCNDHFYAIAGNHDRGFVSVIMLSDKLEDVSAGDSLPVGFAARLKADFPAGELASDLEAGLRSYRDAATSHSVPSASPR
jgi:hypothetical protein